MDITKLSAEQRLHRSHVALMNHKKFILMSGILVSGKTEVVDSGIPTACTDGLNTIYNRNFVTKLDEKELNFVVLHENWHKAYKHTDAPTDEAVINTIEDCVMGAIYEYFDFDDND